MIEQLCEENIDKEHYFTTCNQYQQRLVEFLMTFYGVGMDFFWNCAINKKNITLWNMDESLI